jgi:hypothetical protein
MSDPVADLNPEQVRAYRERAIEARRLGVRPAGEEIRWRTELGQAILVLCDSWLACRGEAGAELTQERGDDQGAERDTGAD